jgi:serine/threonine protein kinase
MTPDDPSFDTGDTTISQPGKPAAPPPDLGPTLGRYRIERPIGRGGMASVYLARDERGQALALKVMNASLRNEPTFVQRFLHEAKATAALQHPNIVTVLDAGEADGQYYLATEFIDGGTVGGLLARQGEMPAAVAAEVVMQVLAGLEHAHTHGVIHRDLKPENLLLTSTGVVKIADFGIARVAEGGTKLTSTGMLIGTAGYMSPEQARGLKLDARSDLYAVGIILYELLTGKNPYESDNPATSLTRIMANAARPIAAVKPLLPVVLEGVLDQLLQLEPDARFPSARAAHDALLPFVAERRRTQPRLLEESLHRPADLKQLLDTQTAELLVAEARPDLEGDAIARLRAGLKLYGALLYDRSHVEARTLFDALTKKQGLYFGPSQNPKLVELERLINEHLDHAPALQQAAQLAKLEGNPLKAAIFLKLYLRARPSDAYAAQQLQQLTGEKTPTPRAPRTAELVAGIAKGGFAASTAAPGTGVRPLTKQRPVVTPSAADLPGIEQRETVNPLPGLLLKVGLVLAALGLLYGGYRKLSRAIDTEAANVMAEDQAAWRAAERRVRDDGGVVGALPDPAPAPSP